ncbi:Formation of crista junctions protein 1, partial [Quaeritorhiza haematococci]
QKSIVTAESAVNDVKEAQVEKVSPKILHKASEEIAHIAHEGLERSEKQKILEEIEEIISGIEKPLVKKLGKAINSLAMTLGELLGASSGPDEYAKIELARKELINVARSLRNLEEDEAFMLAQALKEQSDVAREVQTGKILEMEENLRGEIEAVTQRLRHEYEEQLRKRESDLDKEKQEELRAQIEHMEKHFEKQVKTRVDKERQGRLARLDHLALKLKHLERILLDHGESAEKSFRALRLISALKAVNDVLKRAHRASFAQELAILKDLGRGHPLIEVALSTIPDDVASQGLPTLVELEEYFEYTSSQVRRFQLMPPHGGPLSAALAYAMSFFMWKKKGLVPGDDVESLLARSEHYLKDGDLDSATREMNQLRGWQKKLAQDWILMARRHLEVKQALELIETHLDLLGEGVLG